MTGFVSEPTLPVGHHLHDYEIRKVLGTGGFGITYHAVHRKLGTEVAIKEYMPRDFSSRNSELEIQPYDSSIDHADSVELFKHGLDRFLKEAKALSRFRHPNIIKALNFFEANGTAYIVMEYAHGQTLKEWLVARGNAPDEDELKAIFMPLLDGLQEVHKGGLLHRDIKPDNIYIQEDGTPILLDFGTARNALSSKTRSIHVVVAEGYSPKEQYATEGDQGTWSDVYSLGATLYRCITGKPPPGSMNRSEALYSGRPDPLIDLCSNYTGQYSESLLRVIDHCLQLNQIDRPQTVKDVMNGLMGLSDITERNNDSPASDQEDWPHTFLQSSSARNSTHTSNEHGSGDGNHSLTGDSNQKSTSQLDDDDYWSSFNTQYADGNRGDARTAGQETAEDISDASEEASAKNIDQYDDRSWSSDGRTSLEKATNLYDSNSKIRGEFTEWVDDSQQREYDRSNNETRVNTQVGAIDDHTVLREREETQSAGFDDLTRNHVDRSDDDYWSKSVDEQLTRQYDFPTYDPRDQSDYASDPIYASESGVSYESDDNPWSTTDVDSHTEYNSDLDRESRRTRSWLKPVPILSALIFIVFVGAMLLVGNLFRDRDIPVEQEQAPVPRFVESTAEDETNDLQSNQVPIESTPQKPQNEIASTTSEQIQPQSVSLNDRWFINVGSNGPIDYLDLVSVKQVSDNLPGEQDCQEFVNPFNQDSTMLKKVQVHGFPVPAFWIKRKNGALAICKISESAANIFRHTIPRNPPTRADKAIAPKAR